MIQRQALFVELPNRGGCCVYLREYKKICFRYMDHIEDYSWFFFKDIFIKRCDNLQIKNKNIKQLSTADL